jgi:hypothetical protein
VSEALNNWGQWKIQVRGSERSSQGAAPSALTCRTRHRVTVGRGLMVRLLRLSPSGRNGGSKDVAASRVRVRVSSG